MITENDLDFEVDDFLKPEFIIKLFLFKFKEYSGS